MFRDARPADREAFLGLWTEFITELQPYGGGWKATPETLSDTRNLFDAYVEGSLLGLVVLYHPPGEEPQGFGFIGETGGRGAIRDSRYGKLAHGWGIYLRPEHRQKRIAYYLQVNIGKKIRELGFDTVNYTILAGNEAAIKSAEAVGFELNAHLYKAVVKDWTHG